MAQRALATIERAAVPAIRQTRLFINNEWVDPVDGTCFKTLNPATGEVDASGASLGTAGIDRLDWPIWSKPMHRSWRSSRR